MNTSAAIFLCLLATSGADPSVPDAQFDKARELVRQLADAKFKVRDAAERELVHMGVAALDALKEGEQSSDLHVQERCRQLQPTIRSLNLKKRVESFIAKPTDTLPKDLPFVAQFMKITGDSKEARELYVEALQAHATLLDEVEREAKKEWNNSPDLKQPQPKTAETKKDEPESKKNTKPKKQTEFKKAIERDRNKAAELFGAFCQEANQRAMYRPGVDYRAQQRLITKADVAVYLLLAPELKDTNQVFANFGYTFLNSPNLSENLIKDNSMPLKKIFLNWLEKEPVPYIVQRGVQVAAEAKMPEALPLAIKSIKDSNSPSYTRAQMMLMLTRLGNKEHLKLIEPILGDKTVVGNFNINNIQTQVQMRDVALAVSIKLSGQKMADYDFDVMRANGNEDLFYLSYIYCAFSSDEKRDAAFKKYKESNAAKTKK